MSETPAAYAVFADNGNIRMWWSHPMSEHAVGYARRNSLEVVPLYRQPQKVDPLPGLLSFVAEKAGCAVCDVEWCAWPQVFPTTAGPRGAGGNMCSTFQVYAFRTPTADPLMWCGGVWRRWSGELGQRF